MERALDEGKDCGDILQLITAARGAMNGLMAEFWKIMSDFTFSIHRAKPPLSR